MPAVLKELMRHSSISTTMAYYVSQSAEDVGDQLRMAIGTNPGTNGHTEEKSEELEADANADTITA